MDTLKKDTGIDIKQFHKWLIKNVGERCSEHCLGCFTCACWRVYDNLKEIIEFEEEYEYNVKKDMITAVPKKKNNG